jgi:hypothetical protein
MRLAKKTLVTALGAALCAAVLPPAYAAGSEDVSKAVVTSPARFAAQILDRWLPVAQAAGAYSEAWRDIYGTQLSLMSLNELRRLDALKVGVASTPAADYKRFTQAFLNAQANKYMNSEAAKTNAKLGSATIDQVFVAINPCRIVDTRNVGGVISFGTQRDFYFYVNASSPTYSWTQQGAPDPGTAVSNCPGTVLNGAGGSLGNVAPSAAVATVTAVSPTAAGNFVVWGGQGTFPQSSVVNFTAGQNLANTTVIPAGGRTGGALDFTVRYNGPSGAAHVVVDVVGYFVENEATALNCVHLTNFGTGTANVPNNSGFEVSFPGCTAGYTLSGLGCGYGGSLPLASSLQESSNYWGYCRWAILGAAAPLNGQDFVAETHCCRVPGQ